MTVSAYLNAVYQYYRNSKLGIIQDELNLEYPDLCDDNVFDCTQSTCTITLASGTCGLTIIEND
jgi:hypothetical protein